MSKPRSQVKKEFNESETYLRIKAALEQENPRFQGLGQGEHNDVLYYGRMLDIPNAGICDAIVTSDREIYVDESRNGKFRDKTNYIRDEFGLHYRFSFYGDILDSTWSNESTGEFVDDKKQTLSSKDLFEAIKAINEEYIVHTDPRIHAYIALDIMATYVLPAFESKGRTFFLADKGSGKTRQSMIYQKLAFNALGSSDITAPALFRSIESTKATIIIDDFDSVEEEKKNAILQHYKTGYKKGAKAVRSEGRSNRPTGFDTYSHVVMNNTLGIDPVSLDRSFVIRMLKVGKEHKEITDKKIQHNSQKWQELRDELYVWGLCSYTAIKDCYSTFKIDGFSGRELEKVEAVLVLSKIIGDDVLKELVDYIRVANIREIFDDYSHTWEFNVMQYLWGRVKTPCYVFVSGIVEACLWDCYGVDENSRDYEKRKRSFERWVGKYLKGIPTIRPSYINGRSRYFIDPSILESYIKVQSFSSVILDSTNPTNPTNPTNSTNSTNYTIPTNSLDNFSEDDRSQEVELVEKGELVELHADKGLKERVLSFIKELQGCYDNQAVKLEEILRNLPRLSKEELWDVINELKEKGEIYEPKENHFLAVEEVK